MKGRDATGLPLRLRAMVDAVYPLPEEAWRALVPLATRHAFAPRAHLAPLGSVQRSVGLLEHGHACAYVTRADGRTYNKHLFVAPTFVGDYASLLTGEAVTVPQQAITRCVVWTIPKAALDDLEVRHGAIVQLRRRFAELLYLEKERREIELATLDATERRRRLLARHPTLEDDIPLSHVAAHLAITPTQLSRLRRRSARSTSDST